MSWTPHTQGDGAVTRANSQFKEDPTVPPQFRARLADYQNSGYDRGHLAPAGDNKSSQEGARQPAAHGRNIMDAEGSWPPMLDFCTSSHG